MRTTEHLAILLSNIEESRHKNKTYLNQYKSGVRKLAQELEWVENGLIESQLKFDDLTNPEPAKLRSLHYNLAQTA